MLYVFIKIMFLVIIVSSQYCLIYVGNTAWLLPIPQCSIYYITCLILLSLRYDAGDHLGVYPVNNSELVEAICQRLGADLEEAFTLTNVDGKL